MAKLTRADVEHVALLAKLKLSKKEIPLYQKQLSKIVDYVSELSGVDTKNTRPTSQTTGLENVFREDKVTNDESIRKNGYFETERLINK